MTEREEMTLAAIQAARHALHRIYLGRRATDELAVADTVPPPALQDLADKLRIAEEYATDKHVEWPDRVAYFAEDGPVRIRQIM